MNPIVCQFCGVATDVRHETQQACIDALLSEIDLTRRLLDRTTEAAAAPAFQEDEDRPPA